MGNMGVIMDNEKVGIKLREENPLFILIGKFLGNMGLYEALGPEERRDKAYIILDRLLQDTHFAVSIAEKVIAKYK
jgi:hypothetical protein